MPGRQFSSTTGYRYGFNGKEKDNKDGVVQYDYGFRIYDPRLVRFKSVDPLTKGFPFYTPYQFAGNSPIANIDLDGLEPATVIDKTGKLTTPVVSLINAAFNFPESGLNNTTWINYSNGTLFQRIYAKLKGMPSSTTATTYGNTVLHDGKTTRTDENWLRLVVHEQTHRKQIDEMGSSAVLLEVAGQYLEGSRGRDFSVEQEAYKYGGNWGGNDYAQDLINFNNKEVFQILNDANLKDDQKTERLKAVGKEFRRTTLIPKLIGELNTELQSQTTYLQSNQAKMTSQQKENSNSVITLIQERIVNLKTEQKKLDDEKKTPAHN